MLERVVGRIFRAATTRNETCSTAVNMNASTSQDSNSEHSRHPAHIRLEGDVEIDNSDHVLLKIATLYADRLMSDVTLVVGGVEYPAHRLILCASSEVFQVMLMNPIWSESHESRVVLQESGPCSNIFGEFLRYFYTGQIRINHHTIMPILLLADKYNVKDLTMLCGQYMCNHIAHAATNNQLITWFQYTLSLGHYQVAQACENFLKWNLELVASSSDFVNLQQEIFVRILQQNDLVVRNEMTVYSIVEHWLDAHMWHLTHLDEGMFAVVKQVMSHVRFPMMSPRQLAELLLSPLTKTYKEFFIERMAIGMSYHSNQTDRIMEVCQAEGGLIFTPRLYTADKWSSQLAVENFTQMPPYHTCTLVFSSQAVIAEYAGERTCDWVSQVIDLYPKGVWFRKFFLIVWQGTMEVPECVLRTVRISVTCREFPNTGKDFRVRIGLLITGVQDGVEHTMSVYQRCHRFSQEDKVLHLDDILAFDDLNVIYSNKPKHSPYLVGENRDILKINIVITPLTDFCYLENDNVPIQMFTK